MIKVKNLQKSFGKLEVLKGINETINDHEVVSIIGPSGSGKSTFLRCLNLLEMPTKGELYYDDNRDLIMGSIDAKLQLIEISESFIRKATPIIKTVATWGPSLSTCMILKDVKTGTEYQLSLLGVLKMLKKFQPNILHRFKGLGENDDADIKTTIMDPNTRTLIRVNISDIENDMKVFQTLRGNSAQDALNRKMMMKSFKIPKDQIDT